MIKKTGSTPIRILIRNFPNVEEPWRHCHLCSKFTAYQNDGDGNWTTEVNGGRMHPESDMIEYKGHWYCREHFKFRFSPGFRDVGKRIKKEDDANG